MKPIDYDSSILSKSFNDILLVFLTIYKYFVITVGPPTCMYFVNWCIISHAYLRTLNFRKAFVTINKYFIINVGPPTSKCRKTQEEIECKLYPRNKKNIGTINYMFLKWENLYLSFTQYLICIPNNPSLGMKFDIATENLYLIFFFQNF